LLLFEGSSAILV